MSQHHTIALIVAGGQGLRLGGEVPKQYLSLQGRAILRHTVEKFLTHPLVDAVAVVIHPSHEALYRKAVDGLNLLPVIHGGKERRDSVLHGLMALAALHPDKVLIHDAARPFVSGQIITAVLHETAEGQAAAPVLMLEDTIKQMEGNVISATTDRQALRRVQTPQGFVFEEILSLHRARHPALLTDDIALFEEAGKKAVGVHGSKFNIKITDQEDMQLAESILAGRPEYRTGQGFDVHAFCAPKQPEGNTIRLCGVDVPHRQSLSGHSDADVGLHALTDALLGAVAAEDIGYHFPPSDNHFKGMDSAIFLQKAKELVAEKNGRITHVDVTLICERPKVTPHREAMRARIAALLEIEIERVSVKATTTEKLGFTGREEGIAAQAVATVALYKHFS